MTKTSLMTKPDRRQHSPFFDDCTDVQRRDIEHALLLADELAPSPARGHTGLLILRDALARATGLTVAELIREFSSSSSAKAHAK